jgi:Ser/Thr protein kinase RdoA (MazF antagonist)
MDSAKIKIILQEFGVNTSTVMIQPIQQGLINHTWKITAGEDEYILQRVNDQVFKKPQDIALNIAAIGDYLKQHQPDYFYVNAIDAINGASLVHHYEGWFRLFPFVKGSHTLNTVSSADQAFEAARQFGSFTSKLKGFDAHQLKVTIASFHDLALRYNQFLDALKNGNQNRIKESTELIKQLIQWSFIVEQYEEIKKNPAFKIRVTHHDCKISNVLFDKNDKGICVIDLDTVMPGYFFSDVGDMMRTYLSPVSEEEKDFSKIDIRLEFYQAIVRGYLQEMNDELTNIEKEHFFYAGIFMIYMQALRFLTDHLNDDIYYGSKYPGHNFSRAGNQVVLLQRLLDKKQELMRIPV